MSTQAKPTLEVISRDSSGKGVARKLRAAGSVPAVIYGQDSDPKLLSVSVESVEDLFDNPLRQNVVFDLKFEDGTTVENVMVKSYQVSPVRRDLLHVDFYIIDLDQVIRTKVPIRSVGRAAGVREGGILNVIRPDIDIKARPLDIPSAIEVDVSKLAVGMTIQAEDVEFPEGVEPGYKANYGLFRVVMPRKRAAAAGEEEEEEIEG